MTHTDNTEIARVITLLSEMCDLIGLKTFVGRKTRHGRKPGPSAWHYTAAYLQEYSPATKLEDVVQLFEGLGIANEIRACVWLTIHDELVP